MLSGRWPIVFHARHPSWLLAWLSLTAVCAAQRSPGQWVPPAPLRNVPVLADCQMTRHGVGVSLQPTLFFRMAQSFFVPNANEKLTLRHPGASRFFLVHEYGHLAMRTREEAVADEWAAKQLAMVPAERGTLRAVLSYFVDEGTLFDPLYGTGFDRALRVARAAGIAEREWPAALIAYAKAQEVKRADRNIADASGAGWIPQCRADGHFYRSATDRCSEQRGWGKASCLAEAGSGHHLIQALQVWLYHREPSGVKSEVARRLEAECEFESTGKNVVAIELRFDGESVSIRAERIALGSQESAIH